MPDPNVGINQGSGLMPDPNQMQGDPKIMQPSDPNMGAKDPMRPDAGSTGEGSEMARRDVGEAGDESQSSQGTGKANAADRESGSSTTPGRATGSLDSNADQSAACSPRT
jgi:hypothetical protein